MMADFTVVGINSYDARNDRSIYDASWVEHVSAATLYEAALAARVSRTKDRLAGTDPDEYDYESEKHMEEEVVLCVFEGYVLDEYNRWYNINPKEKTDA